MTKTRRSALVGIIGFSLLMTQLLGCASMQAAQSVRPAVQYYAAVEDYNTAKVIALEYVRQPSTSLYHAEQILAIVQRAEDAIGRIDQLNGAASDTDYAVGLQALTLARSEIARYTAKGVSR